MIWDNHYRHALTLLAISVNDWFFVFFKLYVAVFLIFLFNTYNFGVKSH